MRLLTAGAPLLLGACAAPQSGSVPRFAVPQRFSALGTEPFWAAHVESGRITYTTPEDRAGKSIAIRRSDGPSSVEIAGTLSRQRLTLVVTAGPCSDGMSDTVYPYTVELRLGDDSRRGCARAD